MHQHQSGPPSASKITTINNSPRTFSNIPAGRPHREMEFMRNRNDERKYGLIVVVGPRSLHIDKCFARCQFGRDLPPLWLARLRIITWPVSSVVSHRVKCLLPSPSGCYHVLFMFRGGKLSQVWLFTSPSSQSQTLCWGSPDRLSNEKMSKPDKLHRWSGTSRKYFFQLK